MISYFKYLVTITLAALGLIVGTASFFFYKNMSDVRNDATRAIESSKENADHEIRKIQSSSADIARAEAQKRVEEAFSKGNVQELIERAARERVAKAVDREIDKNLASRIDQLQKQIAETGEISNAGARLRLGYRSGLDTILDKMKSPNAYISQYAKSTLTLIGSDYEAAVGMGYGSPSCGKQAMSRWISPVPQTLREVMVFIRQGVGPGAQGGGAQVTAAAFCGFREMSGSNIQVFDVPAAEKWCAENRPKCD